MRKYIQSFISFWQDLTLPLQILFGVSCIISLVLSIIGVITRGIFTYDQARDALQAYAIWHDHHLKLLGPETDIPGVFHGVLWYYLLAVFYGIGKVPEFVIATFSLFSFATAIVVGILAHKLFKNTITTSLAIIFYILSPLFQTTTRWLSNPVLAFLMTPILLLLLWKFIEKRNTWIAFLIGVCFGVIIQGEFAFVLLLIILPVYWIVFRWEIHITDVGGFLVGILLATASFFIAEIKFKGQAVKGMVEFLHGGSSSHNVWQTVVFIWNRCADFLSITFYPFPRWLLACSIVLFTIALVKFGKTQKKPILFLLIWSSTLMIFLLFHVGISTSYFLFYPFLIPLILLVSFALSKIKNTILFLCVVCIMLIVQIDGSFGYLKTNTSPLPAQQGTTLPLAKEVINYSYRNSHGKPFTIITVTNPLFINSTWAYLYNTYGLPNYGYVPYFEGRSQKDNVGTLPEKQFATEARYLIIEPTIGIPEVYITEAIYQENLVSQVVATQHFGGYIIEKRKLHFNK